MEYPNLSFSSDPEIERYFELRNAGKVTEAFAVYNTYLRPRYPDEQQRILILKAYRSRDPLYKQLLLVGVVAQANRTVEQIKNTITVLTDTVGKLNMSDAYSIIRTFDKISTGLSEDKYQAISIVERLTSYAKMLDFRHEEMTQVLQLLRMYVTNTLDTVNSFKKEQEESRRKKIAQDKRKNSLSDFSSIQISEGDAAAILIAPSISRIEDKVIAYCIKYWNRTSDETFEKIIYLYSKKYNTNHLSIYQAIKTGKKSGYRDEEILHSVLSIISSGYYYNIRGDLYLQIMWKRLKDRFITPPSVQSDQMPQKIAAKRSVASVRKQKTPAVSAASPEQSTEKAVSAPSPIQPAEKGFSIASRKKIVQSPEPTQKPAKAVAAASRKKRDAPPETVKTLTKAVSTKPSEQDISPSTAKKKSSETQPQESAPARPIYHPVQGSEERKTPAATKNAVRTISISDYIKKLSGLSYDLYKDLFFAQVRPAIRTVLDKSRTKKSFFDNNQDEAEELVVSFFRDNYTNPYMDWEGSAEKAKLQGLGYDMTFIFPIIDIWYKKKSI
ncbi:MAG: hypothetical protein LBU99_04055 [Spirochaetaceae bacterium]|nr:hypothetical protein [Spirochaetaceae bacterium]